MVIKQSVAESGRQHLVHGFASAERLRNKREYRHHVGDLGRTSASSGIRHANKFLARCTKCGLRTFVLCKNISRQSSPRWPRAAPSCRQGAISSFQKGKIIIYTLVRDWQPYRSARPQAGRIHPPATRHVYFLPTWPFASVAAWNLCPPLAQVIAYENPGPSSRGPEVSGSVGERTESILK
jgi:hypothetical protein